MPPLRSQRILILAALAIVAWLLHVNACEWAWQRQSMGSPTTPRPILILRTYEAAPFGGGSARVEPITALYPQGGVNKLVAVTAGIIVPLLLLGLDAYLILGWRYQLRIARGQCPQCGYDLRAQHATTGAQTAAPANDEPISASSSARCPECGCQIPQIAGAGSH